MSEVPAVKLDIRERLVAELKPWKRNARTHSAKQLKLLEASIRQFGFNNPILADSDGHILAGHGRWEAAKRLGMERVPTVCLAHLNEKQRRAYVIADNKLAELAGRDAELLRLELGELVNLDLGFDIEVTGFSTTEIDNILDLSPEAQVDPKADAMPELQPKPVSKVGDLWTLGKQMWGIVPVATSRLCASLANVAALFRGPIYVSDPLT